MYYTVIRHLCTLWDDRHYKSSNHLSLYAVIMLLLTIFLMLYITSLWLIAEGLYLLIRFTYFIPHSPLLWQPLTPMSLFHLFCFLDSTYMWDHMVFFFLWLISLNIIPSNPSMSSQTARFLSYGWVIIQCVCVCVCVCGTDEPIFRAGIERQRCREWMYGHSGEGEGGINWESSTGMHTLHCLVAQSCLTLLRPRGL